MTNRETKSALIMKLRFCLLAFFFGVSLNSFAASVPLEVTPIAPERVETRGAVTFADFGRAAYGNLQLTLPSSATATTLTVRLGEKLADDGSLDRKPPGSVNYREVQLVTRDGSGVYQLVIPSKKFHLGAASVKTPASIGEVTPFRYVEIENSTTPLTAADLRQLAVHAPFNDSASTFTSSDDTLNAVWSLCKYTMKATTTFGVYIDGERERIPYEGDVYINLLSHYACDLDPRVARATFAHLLKHPTWPTEWSLHMPMIAEADYDATGDPVLAAQHYDAIKKKLLLNKAGADGLLRASAIVDWPPVERDGYNDGVVDPREKKQVGPEVNTVANAFYYRALRSMARLATALKKDSEARDFTAKADQVYAAFNATFFDTTRRIYIDGQGSTHASLHANMFPLAFGLVPAERRAAVLDFVQSRGMACSVYGAQYLLEALYENGRADYALSLMAAHSNRSWCHMIEQGSTMTLEAWNPRVKPNLTWNHAWGAAPANIISRYLLGVRPLSPGYTQILIAPQPGTLTSMQGQVPTPRGPVGVSWEKSPVARFTIDVPPGTPAQFVLPGRAPESLAPGRHLIRLSTP